MHYSTAMSRGAVAIVASAILLAGSLTGLPAAHARRQQMQPGMGPQTAFGRTARGGMKVGGRVGQLGGIGAMAVGALTMNPFIFGGGFLAAASGTIVNRAGRKWGEMPNQQRPNKGNIFARVGKFGLRTTGRVGKLAGFGGMILGALTLNPFLFGGGLAVAVGGHGLKKLGQRPPGMFFGGNQPGAGNQFQGGQPMDYDMDGMREGRHEMPMGQPPGGMGQMNNPALANYPGFAR